MHLRKTAALVVMLTLALFITCGQQMSEDQILAKAKDIHERAITLDTHVDIPGAIYATAELDPGIDNPRLKCDLVKMKNGGLDGVFLAVYVGQGKRDAAGYKRAYDQAMGKFEAIHRLTEEMHPDKCELALTPDDVERIAKTDKRAIMIGVENGFPIGTDLSNVEKFYNLGTRYITLCHGGHNQICDSATPRAQLGDTESEHDGLSDFGVKVVAEMNRLGIMADVSHIATSSYWDLIEVTKAPIIATHSGCRALTDHPRNLDDDQLKALTKNGGVIQIVALGSFLDTKEHTEAIAALNAEMQLPDRRARRNMSEAELAALKPKFDEYERRVAEIEKQYPAPDVKRYVDHIDHAVEIAGINHVGIGTDFDGGAGIPGFNTHAECLNVTVELVRRAYSEEDIMKIWGGNLLRVWRDVEKVAKELQAAN